ncbi:hypothetical protein [Parvibaculum sedimenti]|uniref:hypothetical protein n=1 Tax=Parvibaculum sedimenti TaxID=2608632 RepID=UPI001FE6617D|nr:hypothetical protein [Parvibaculum sedimenti]
MAAGFAVGPAFFTAGFFAAGFAAAFFAGTVFAAAAAFALAVGFLAAGALAFGAAFLTFVVTPDFLAEIAFAINAPPVGCLYRPRGIRRLLPPTFGAKNAGS